MTELWFLIAGAILGYILSDLNQRVIKRPKVEIKVGKNADGPTHRFLHVEVSNVERTGIPALFRGNIVIEHAKARVKIIDPATKSVICEYIARWSSKAEPLDNINYLNNQGTFNPQMAIDAESEVIIPGETKPLTIALKHNGKSYFVGFNNWSYFMHQNWEDDELRVDLKSAIVQFELWANGRRIMSRFAVINPNKNHKSFQLRSK